MKKKKEKGKGLFLISAFGIFIVMLSSCGSAERDSSLDVILKVDLAAESKPVDPRVYGLFLEHIYRSVDGGLDSECLRFGDFEESLSQDVIEAPTFVLTGKAPEVISGRVRLSGVENIPALLRLRNPDPMNSFFKPPFSVIVKLARISGGGPIFISPRLEGESPLLWILGAESGKKAAVASPGADGPNPILGTEAEIDMPLNKPNIVRIDVLNDKIHFLLNGRLVSQFNISGYPSGVVAIGVPPGNSVEIETITIEEQNKQIVHFGPEDIVNKISSVQEGVAYGWHRYGAGIGQLQVTSDAPYQGRSSQRILAESPNIGVAREGIVLKRGGRYKGSFALRGHGGPLLVRLLSGEKIQSEVKFGDLPEQWQEWDFDLVSQEDTAQGKLAFFLAGPGVVELDAAWLRPVRNGNIQLYRDDLFGRIAELKPVFIRWPGGCFAENYRWKEAIGRSYERIRRSDPPPWGAYDPNSFGTAEFTAFCREIKAEPLICLNIGQHAPDSEEGKYLKEALEWIEYANGDVATPMGKLRAQHGRPEPYNIHYWQLGNETWPMGKEAYAKRARRFAEAIRAKYPDLILVATGPNGINPDWTAAMVEQLGDMVDFIDGHHYGAGQTYTERMRSALDYGKFLEIEKNAIKSAGKRVRPAVLEWGLLSSTQEAGLWAGLFLNAAERNSDMGLLASPGMLLRNTDAPWWPIALIHFDALNSYFSPQGQVFKTYRRFFAGRLLNSEIKTPAIEGGLPAIDAVATTDGERLIVKVVNLADKPVRFKLEVSGGKIKWPCLHTIVSGPALDASNSILSPAVVSTTVKEVFPESTDSNEAVLKPLSVNILSFPLKSPAAKAEEKPLSAVSSRERLDQLEVRLKRCFRYAELCKDAGEDITPVVETVRRAAKAISEDNLDLAEKAAGEAELFLTGSAEPIPPKLVRFPSPDQLGWMYGDVTYFILEHKLEGEDIAPYEKELKDIVEYASGVTHEDQLVRIREVISRLFKLLRKLGEPERERAIRSRIQNADSKIVEAVRRRNQLFLEKLRPKLPSTDALIIDALDKKYRIAIEMYHGGHYQEAISLLDEATGMIENAGPGLSLNKLSELEKLPGAMALGATGKVIAPQKGGYYLSLFMPPQTFGEKSMAALTGSHFAAVYCFATWRPFMRGTIDESILFDEWWDIDQALYLRDGWRCGKVAMTFRQSLDLLNLYGAVPYIGWSPRAGGWSEFMPRYNLPELVPRLQEIIDGKYDDYIRSFARQIRDWGKPAFIEFSTEMNGDGQPHGAPHDFGPKGETEVEDVAYPTRWWKSILGLPPDPAEPKYELLNNQYGDPKVPDGPERVRDAWRHIHDIFDQEGVSNVTWATHTPSGVAGQFPGTPQAQDALRWAKWKNFWPGDNYVDWGGTSAYFGNAPPEAKVIPNADSFDITVEWSYLDFHSSSWKNKPFAIPEFHFDGPPEKAADIYARIFGKILPEKFSKAALFNYSPNDIGGFAAVPGLAQGWKKSVVENPLYQPYPEFNPDHTPPGRITDLKAETIDGGIKLSWTAPGNDENTGTAARYILKYRNQRLNSSGGVEKDFAKEPWRLWSANDTYEISNPPEPAPAGTKQEMIIRNIKTGTYWFAIQSIDDVPYNSRISNVLEVSIP